MNLIINNAEDVTLEELYVLNEATGMEFIIEDGAVTQVNF